LDSTETTANDKLWILLKMADLYITIIVHNTTSKKENGLLYLPEAAKELLKARRMSYTTGTELTG